MNNKVIGGVLVAALVIIIGVGIYYTTHSQQNTTDNKTTEAIDPTKVFEPKAPADLDFEATVASNGSTQPLDLKIKHTKNGDIESVTGMSGVNLTTYIINDEYIQCTAGQCLSSGKIPTGQQIVNNNYAFTKEYLAGLQRGSKYAGSEDCGKDKCAKWTINNEVFQGTFYIDSQNRINKIVSDNKDSSNTKPTVSYTYSSVSIVRPDNVQNVQTQTTTPAS